MTVRPADPAADASVDGVNARSAADLLARCRRLADAEDWATILELTEDDDQVRQHPRSLQYAIMAAKNVGAIERFPAIARQVRNLPESTESQIKIKLVLARDLAKSGAAKPAAEMFLDCPGLHGNPFVHKILPHIVRNIGEKRVAKSVLSAVAAATGGKLGLEPEPSQYSFAPRTGKHVAMGRAHVSASPHVSSHHVDGFNEELERFSRSIVRGISSASTPLIGEYQNVFTDRNEQIWSESGAVIRSKGVPIASVTRVEVPNIGVAMMAQTKTRGLYHWLVDRLPRFGWLGNPTNAADDIPILVSDNAAGFVPDSLSMMGLAGRTVPVGDAVFVERLLVPTVGFVNMAGWSHVDWGLQRLVDESMATARAAAVDLPRRIYISRRDAKRRVMTNEAELEARLAARGFEIFEFSKIPLWHQIALVRSADIVLAPHGAGLAHLIAARPTLRVIEILPIKDGTYLLRFNYARLSAIKQLDYHAWLEVQSPRANEWSVDLATFLPFLDQALAS